MSLTSPTLLLDKEKCLRNIKWAVDKAKKHNVSYRPHFKTHQSAEVGRWFREFGVDICTVSSLSMAHYFAAAGWSDITIAFPVNVKEIRAINELAGRIQLNVIVENLEALETLESKLANPVNAYVKIDTGYGRTGISYTETEIIKEIVTQLRHSKNVRFAGLLAHAGHSYHVGHPTGVESIHLECVSAMRALQDYFGVDAKLSIGDTPTFTLSADFALIDEVRPGNLVFYDTMQHEAHVCGWEQIAVCMACPVVAKHPERNAIIIHGGAVHFSKDTSRDNLAIGSTDHYGLVVRLEENGWSAPIEGMRLAKVSQEHGTITYEGNSEDQFKIGDLLGVLPVHSCLTADLMREYTTIDGEKISCMPKPYSLT